MAFQNDAHRTYRPAPSPVAPPLPPRPSSAYLSLQSETPPPYSAVNEQDARPYPSNTWTSHDPRSSSTQSLLPEKQDLGGRRKLMLIYIHGFMGNETSFQSFPAHVHNLVTVTLAQTHVVHTKIYPRYRSRKALQVARDDFSRWLAANESLDTDVVLLGHSMGGLLAAEVVLKPPSPLAIATGRSLCHNIIGTINFDTPFLGMHPGVIASGISSLFRRSPSPPAHHNSDSAQSISPGLVESQNQFASSSTSLTTSLSPTPSRADTMSSTQPDDPNYNPAFANDIVLPVRKGWNSALHFISKHSDSLTKATKEYVKSHVEFGGAMADYPGLKARYARIRALEEEDESARRSAVNYGTTPPRVRFVNYYTASTGRPKKLKSPLGSPNDDQAGRDAAPEAGLQDLSLTASATQEKHSVSPRISIEEHRDDGDIIRKSLEEEEAAQLSRDMEHIDPIAEPRTPSPSPSVEPEAESDLTPNDPISNDPTSPPPLREPPTVSEHPSLPPLPPPPSAPAPPDPSQYPSKDALKLAEKDHARALKAYQRALKDHTAALKDRAKLAEKRAKAAQKDAAAQAKAAEKQRRESEKADAKARKEQQKQEEERREDEARPQTQTQQSEQPSQPPPPPPSQHIPSHPRPHPNTTFTPFALPAQPKRDRKFCVLPGTPDATWVRVFMEGVDEVGAHCGLFFLSETYERLVGDVGARIEEWVRLEADRRLAERWGGGVD